MFARSDSQTVRNRRDRIGVNERVFNRRAIIAVRTEQSRVGSMQRRDNFRRAVADHLPGEKGGGGVRHSVVHMKNIERFCSADLRHFYREGQRVIGTRKQFVFTDRDLVKVNSRRRKIEPDRFRVAEEMNLVSARRQFGPERGGENSAAADERKTGDPNFKSRDFIGPIAPSIRFVRIGDFVALHESDTRRVGFVQILSLTRAGDVMRAADDRLHPAQTRIARRADLLRRHAPATAVRCNDPRLCAAAVFRPGNVPAQFRLPIRHRRNNRQPWRPVFGMSGSLERSTRIPSSNPMRAYISRQKSATFEAVNRFEMLDQLGSNIVRQLPRHFLLPVRHNSFRVER